MAEPIRWWSMRPAQNLKPATYRCPLCDKYLPALSEHVLIAPEGDTSRRRHAHTACVLAARKAGRLPTGRSGAGPSPDRRRCGGACARGCSGRREHQSN